MAYDRGVEEVKRRWTDEEINFLAEHWDSKQIRWISKQLNRTEAAIRIKANKLNFYKEKVREYAVYKGDKLIAMGTAEECSQELNVTPDYIRWMNSPFYQRKLSKRKQPECCTSVVRLDDDNE
jgi:CDP-glycerol glycerophosphotransferase (TagB/SpsB family)